MPPGAAKGKPAIRECSSLLTESICLILGIMSISRRRVEASASRNASCRWPRTSGSRQNAAGPSQLDAGRNQMEEGGFRMGFQPALDQLARQPALLGKVAEELADVLQVLEAVVQAGGAAQVLEHLGGVVVAASVVDARGQGRRSGTMPWRRPSRCGTFF